MNQFVGGGGMRKVARESSAEKERSCVCMHSEWPPNRSLVMVVVTSITRKERKAKQTDDYVRVVYSRFWWYIRATLTGGQIKIKSKNARTSSFGGGNRLGNRERERAWWVCWLLATSNYYPRLEGKSRKNWLTTGFPCLWCSLLQEESTQMFFFIPCVHFK